MTVLPVGLRDGYSVAAMGLQSEKRVKDHCRLLDLFGAHGRMDSVVPGKNLSGIDLYFAWVNGEKKYLDR